MVPKSKITRALSKLQSNFTEIDTKITNQLLKFDNSKWTNNEKRKLIASVRFYNLKQDEKPSIERY